MSPRAYGRLSYGLWAAGGISAAMISTTLWVRSVEASALGEGPAPVADDDRTLVDALHVHLSAADGRAFSGLYSAAQVGKPTVLRLPDAREQAGQAFARLATLRALGYGVLTVDHGGELGRIPQESRLSQAARSAWDFLVDEEAVPAHDIVLWGRGVGCSSAAKLATRERPRSLIVESGFTSWPELVLGGPENTPVRWLLSESFPIRELLAKVKTRVLIAHAPDDAVIPFEHAQALSDATRLSVGLVRMSGGHDGGLLDTQAHRERVRQFLDAPRLIEDSAAARVASHGHGEHDHFHLGH